MINLSKQKQITVGEIESFAHLIRAAQEDSDFRATLCGILLQPSFHRQSMLNTMIRNMGVDGVKEEITRALAALTDDEVAERVLDMLKK